MVETEELDIFQRMVVHTLQRQLDSKADDFYEAICTVIGVLRNTLRPFHMHLFVEASKDHLHGLLAPDKIRFLTGVLGRFSSSKVGSNAEGEKRGGPVNMSSRVVMAKLKELIHQRVSGTLPTKEYEIAKNDLLRGD